MEPGRTRQLEYALENVSAGIVLLDARTLHIQYMNDYLRPLLARRWQSRDLSGQPLVDILPKKIRAPITAHLQQVIQTGKQAQYDEVPYEGSIEARGRTYWRISIKHTSFPAATPSEEPESPALLITIEDVTEIVHSRLHLNATQYISSAIGEPASLHQVLERILQALYEMVGSRRCAIYLRNWPGNGQGSGEISFPSTPGSSAIMVAQRGIHPEAQNWQQQLTPAFLLGRILQEQRTLLITDTAETPELEFPLLNYQGRSCRPGSVLCVPIFEPRSTATTVTLRDPFQEGMPHAETILGSIEVYHRQARGFPAEEVELLERFAQQAGLAIQHARLFRSIERLARTASRHARQKENIMQSIPDGVIIYDPRWRIADTNLAVRQIFGWSEDINGKTVVQAFSQSKASFLFDFLQETDPVAELERRALQGQIDELKIQTISGIARTLRCSHAPIRDELGDIFAFITIYHDVTEEVANRERIEAEVIARTVELKQRNEALQSARETQEVLHARMALLLENLPSGILLVSAQQNTITIINRQAVQMFQDLGIALEPVDDPDEACQRAIGLPCEPLFRAISAWDSSGAPLPYEQQPLFQALKSGKSEEAELRFLRKDGQSVYLLVNSAPLRASDGQITSAILVLQEITRIKSLESAREDFFTTMAHELKTPLANIRAHLSALLANDLQWSSATQHTYIQTADEQVERIVGMINHFLDASRVEAGALRLAREPILIPELFEDLQDRLAALITSSQRSLQIALPDNLPAVPGDYELLISVFTNLLSNAFRYTPEGDFVLLGAEQIFENGRPMAVRLSVTDHGPGISQEQQAMLFTRFSTFAAMHRPSIERPGQPALEEPRRMTRWSPATGLGLYISRGIIEAHGSELTLISIPGQETTFRFTLPVFQRLPEMSNQRILLRKGGT